MIKKDKTTETMAQCATQDIGRFFYLTNEQNDKLKEWMKSLPKPDKPFGTIDFGYTYSFTPTGLGEIIKVKRGDGFEIDLTDYDNW